MTDDQAAASQPSGESVVTWCNWILEIAALRNPEVIEHLEDDDYDLVQVGSVLCRAIQQLAADLGRPTGDPAPVDDIPIAGLLASLEPFENFRALCVNRHLGFPNRPRPHPRQSLHHLCLEVLRAIQGTRTQNWTLANIRHLIWRAFQDEQHHYKIWQANLPAHHPAFTVIIHPPFQPPA